MRASKGNMDTETSVNKNKSTNAVQANKFAQNTIMINILPVLSMVMAILPELIWKSSGIDVAKIGILTLILTTVAVFYIRMNADTLLYKKYSQTLLTICYLASIALLLFVPNSDIFSLWMIGGLLVAMLIDSKLGLLFHFNLSFILGITMSLRPEMVIQLLIIGVLISLLSSSLCQKSTVIYAAIIILSSNITLSFVIHNFIFETSSNFNYLSSFFSIFAVLVIAFLLHSLFERFMVSAIIPDIYATLEAKEIAENDYVDIRKNDDKEDELIIPSNGEVITMSIQSLEPEADPQYTSKLRTSYEVLNSEENELLLQLKEYSQPLYKHALMIGNLSSRAAKIVGADEMLTKAGGLYHEIGKIAGKNYIEEGLLLAEQYSFPNDLKNILKQHNIKYEKQTSVEAAIVMLSDNVVSTIEYIEKTEDHKFTTNKIIDNIFQMRMEKGTFDECGLSVKDFKLLKEFYQKEFSSHHNQ